MGCGYSVPKKHSVSCQTEVPRQKVAASSITHHAADGTVPSIVTAEHGTGIATVDVVLEPSIDDQLAQALRDGVFMPPVPRGLECRGIVCEIVDGDTIGVMCWIKEAPTFLRLRVSDIDTPEIRGGTALSKAAGHRASQIAANYVNSAVFTWDEKSPAPKLIEDADGKHKFVRVHIQEPDKYGGRWVGTVTPDGMVLTLSQELLRVGAAQSYTGRVRKSAWSDDDLYALKRTKVIAAQP